MKGRFAPDGTIIILTPTPKPKGCAEFVGGKS